MSTRLFQEVMHVGRIKPHQNTETRRGIPADGPSVAVLAAALSKDMESH